MTESMPAMDRFHLHRFVEAQAATFELALEELQAGRKRSHWMWFIFPQFTGLGTSVMAQRYAIALLAEAATYLAHPILGMRLQTCMQALLAIEGRSAFDIMGFPDERKLHSCATLFALISPDGSCFEHVLNKYFDGIADTATLECVASAATRTHS